MSEVTITVAELAELLDGARTGGGSLRLLDVRYDPAAGTGREEWAQGHIDGAVHVDLPAELSRPPRPGEGRHPLPGRAELQEAARRWGIGQDSDVVVYDARSGLSAARAWWLLRWGGLRSVRILEGGLPAWLAAGHALSTEPSEPPPGDVVLPGGRLPVLDAAAAAELGRDGRLLDARAATAYESGHIPGARSAPAAENTADGGVLRPADVLRRRYAALLRDPVPDGDETVGVYCGSGVSAAFQAAVLTDLGIPVALYPGSWSEWAADGTQPVETGADPRPLAPLPHHDATTRAEPRAEEGRRP
ncbi:sulfurtransferase [Streptomyces nanshensis]|uniref:sulfurtransferase n=1 Tax=Streptomyces nanshensis TaxID=518642 RepID=UPI00085C4C38|nr:sulfurtransferase [Streptomyces nanshensis]